MRNPIFLVFLGLAATLYLAWLIDPAQQALRGDAVASLHRQIQASPTLGAALVAADRGDSGPLVGWLGQAERGQRRLLFATIEKLAQDRLPKDANGERVQGIGPFHLYRHRLLAFTAVATGDPQLDQEIDNAVAYALVAGPVPPTAEELTQAVGLSERIQAAVPENDHARWDTIGCVRFRQGDWVRAQQAFGRAVTQGEADTALGKPGENRPVIELYRRRLAAAEANAKHSVEQRDTPATLADLPLEKS